MEGTAVRICAQNYIYNNTRRLVCSILFHAHMRTANIPSTSIDSEGYGCAHMRMGNNIWNNKDSTHIILCAYAHHYPLIDNETTIYGVWLCAYAHGTKTVGWYVCIVYNSVRICATHYPLIDNETFC